MNCPKCNSFVPDGLESCPICGEPMNAVAETEEKPKVANCGARNVLFFISIASLIVSLLNMGIGVLDINSIDCVPNLVAGLVEINVFWILLIIANKTQPAYECNVTSGQKTGSMIIKITASVLLVATMFSAVIVNGIKVAKATGETKESVIGSLFRGTETDGIYTEYEFVKKGKCIKRTVHDQSYTVVTDEKEVSYSIARDGEKAFSITIDGTRFTAENCKPGDYIGSFENGSDSFSKVNGLVSLLEKNTVAVTDFVRCYNSDFKSNGGATASSEKYINVAENIVYSKLLSPKSAVFHGSTILERDSTGKALVAVDVSSDNAFGVSLRSTFYVLVYYVDGAYKYHPDACYTTDPNQVSYLKTVNYFGYDPIAEENEDIIIEVAGNYEIAAATVNGHELFVTKATANLASLKLYTVDSTENVAAVCIEIPKAGLRDNSDYPLVMKMVTTACDEFSRGNYSPSIDEIRAYFNPEIGFADSDTKLLSKGYIVKVAEDDGKYYFTMTYGRGLEITEDAVWTPIELVEGMESDTPDKEEAVKPTPDTTGKTDTTTRPTPSETTPPETQKVPADTTREPDETEKVPDETTRVPEDTTAPPEETVHVHSYVNHQGVAATCTMPGHTSYKTCSCGYSDYEEIAALGHDYVVSETKPAECVTGGYTEYECSRCHDSYKDIIPSIGHSFTEADCSSPATCTGCGMTTGEPAHVWYDVTEVVHHDEVGHYEDVEVTVYIDKYRCPLCSYAQPLHDSLEAYYAHFDSTHSEDSLAGAMRERYEILQRYDYVYEEQWIVDVEAYDEVVVVGRKCSLCNTEE